MPISQFGQKVAHFVQELNTLCQEFFRYINSTVFEDEEQIQDALSVFQTSVMKSAVGTDRYKKQFYDQIERMLLNPPAHVAESRPRLLVITVTRRLATLEARPSGPVTDSTESLGTESSRH